MRIRIIWTLVLSLALGAAVQAAPSRAAVTVGVSPSVVEVSGKAGGMGEVDLTILNQGDEPFDVTITSQAYERADPSLSVPDWLSLDRDTAHVVTGSQEIVKVTIAIPEGEQSGGRYAAVAITTGTPDPEGNVTAISGRLIVPILITVEGNLEREAEIERFAAVLELDGRLGFRTQVGNAGNIHWKSGGTAIVERSEGSDYGTLDLEQTTIFPQGSETLATTSTLPVESGGTYRATIELVYGEDESVTAETEFTFTANLSITGSACENLDRGPTMTASLTNGGNLGVVSNVNMAVSTATGQAIGQTGLAGPDIAWPNDTTTIAVDLPDRLQSGDYLLTILAQTGASADPIVQEIPFSIGGTGPNVAPICPQPESTPEGD